MTQFISCDYCAQNNYPDALCCQFCGAPMPILLPGISPKITQVLEVKGHEMQTYGTMMMSCSTSALDYPYAELCTTGSTLHPDLQQIKADEEARRAWSEGYNLDPKHDLEINFNLDPGHDLDNGFNFDREHDRKKGWREWLGIGGK